MSTLLSTQSIDYDNSFGPLLVEVSFSLKKGDRIGLIGHNGCGKSTLLKILSGEITASRGSVTIAHHCLMARVEQHLPSALVQSTLLDALLNRLPDSLRQTESWQAEVLLGNMGFAPETWSSTAGTLSGGQHTRLLLARALIHQPDLLLLDEPSNHLDLPTLLWLEQFLQSWDGSFVLVSHDIRLLDSVTNCTWILRDKDLQFIRLPCSQARQALAEKDQADVHRYQAEQKEIARIAQSAKRLALWGSEFDNEKLARKAKQIEKQIRRLQDEQTQLTAGYQWQLQLKGEALAADSLLALTDLQVRPTPEAPVLFSLDQLWVKSGDRIALVGRNGCGKSSLLQLLWQQFNQPVHENQNVLFHPRVRVGYYDQSQQQLCDQDKLIDALIPFAPLTEVQRKMALIGAGFTYLRHQQTVSTLSGGERSRLLFIGLTLANYSLLLLDEPTNHLDMEGKAELAETLSSFGGAVLLVSHDRHLIEQSCNRFWLVHQQQLSEWHDLASVYALLADKPLPVILPTKVDTEPLIVTSVMTTPSEEEGWLAELLVLEEKLTEDLARKAKHQKPELQCQWQQQISRLNMLLGLD